MVAADETLPEVAVIVSAPMVIPAVYVTDTAPSEVYAVAGDTVPYRAENRMGVPLRTAFPAES